MVEEGAGEEEEEWETNMEKSAMVEGMLGKEKGRSLGKECRGKKEKGRRKVSSPSLSMTNFMEGERGPTGEGRTREQKK